MRGPSARLERIARRATLGVAATIAGLTLALSAPMASQAAESTVPISFSFKDLMPGVPASQMIELKIPRDGSLDEFMWVERTGILKTATFAFEVCKTPTSCVAASTVERPLPVKAGTLAVRVSVTITEQGNGTAIGKLTLTSDEAGTLGESVEGSNGVFGSSTGTLASTGVNAFSIALWGAAALSLGAVVLLWPRTHLLAARRRRTNEDRADEDRSSKDRAEEGTR